MAENTSHEYLHVKTNDVENDSPDDTCRRRKKTKIVVLFSSGIMFIICLLSIFLILSGNEERKQTEATTYPKQTEATTYPKQTEITTYPNQTADIKIDNVETTLEPLSNGAGFITNLYLIMKQPTLVHLFGTVNDGEIPYNVYDFCGESFEESCNMTANVKEELIKGKKVTLNLEPKEHIHSVNGHLHYLQTQKKTIEFNQFKNVITIPNAAERFTICIKVEVEEFTHIHVYRKINGQRSHITHHNCNKICDFEIPVDEKLVSKDNVTVVVNAEEQINSLHGSIVYYILS